MTKVGEVTGICVPSPAPIPCTKTVLPAPSRPTRTTRAPGRAPAGAAAPRSPRPPGGATDSSRARVIAARSSAPADQRRREGDVGVEGPHRLAVRPVTQRAGRVVGRQDPPPVDLVHPTADLAQQERARSPEPWIQEPG